MSSTEQLTIEAFTVWWDGICRQYRKTPSEDSIAGLFEQLAGYTLTQLRAAVQQHQEGPKGQYLPHGPELKSILHRLYPQVKTGDTVESRRCRYVHGDQRCPGFVSLFEGAAKHGFCVWHRATKGDPEGSRLVLESLLRDGVPPQPPDWRDIVLTAITEERMSNKEAIALSVKIWEDYEASIRRVRDSATKARAAQGQRRQVDPRTARVMDLIRGAARNFAMPAAH